MSTLVCTQCGSTDTSSLAWVNNETNEIEEYTGSSGSEDDNFCNDCSEGVPLISLQELKKECEEARFDKTDRLVEPLYWFEKGTPRREIIGYINKTLAQR